MGLMDMVGGLMSGSGGQEPVQNPMLNAVIGMIQQHPSSLTNSAPGGNSPALRKLKVMAG